jgi:hypothetical protein
MMRSVVRFLSAYVVFALTMCIVAALLLAGFAYKPKDFLIGFEVSFLLAAMVIPLHISIAFVCSWIIIARVGEAIIVGWTLRSGAERAGYLYLSRCPMPTLPSGGLDGIRTSTECSRASGRLWRAWFSAELPADLPRALSGVIC